jgi:hypothetical protein
MQSRIRPSNQLVSAVIVQQWETDFGISKFDLRTPRISKMVDAGTHTHLLLGRDLRRVAALRDQQLK